MPVTIIDRIEDLEQPVPEGAYVVIDVFRFSTTVAALLNAGADAVHPFADPDDARAFGDETGAVLFGERSGEKLAGFDHTNSPVTASTLVLDGQPVGICTTNGTRAIGAIGDHPIVVGSTVNAAAVGQYLQRIEDDIFLVAVGTEGKETPEDRVGAELIRAYIDGDGPNGRELASFRERMQDSYYADHLRDLGHGDDVAFACRFNSINVVPRLVDGAIRDADSTDG